MPYCPCCHEEACAGAARCPLDGHLYVESRCPACREEVFPGERYCRSCGARLATPLSCGVVPLEPASLPQRAVATIIDLLVLFVLVQMVLHSGWLHSAPFSGPATLALAAAAIYAVYFTLAHWKGHQSLGQHVTGTVVLDERRLPLSLPRSLGRALASLVSAVTVAPLLAVLCDAERRSLADRWSATRMWRVERG